MTYYKSNFYPVGGTPDDPVPVWEEFARMQAYFGSIDQNNVAKDGISSGRIVNCDDPDHNGISDIRTDDTAYMGQALQQPHFPYIEIDGEAMSPFGDVNLLTLYPSTSGVWYRTEAGSFGVGVPSEVKLDLFSRWECPWIFGASVEFGGQLVAYGAERRVQMRINTNKSSQSVDVATGIINSRDPGDFPRTALCSMATMIIPPGKFEAYLTFRALWDLTATYYPEVIGGEGGEDVGASVSPGPGETIFVARANLFAFALYR